MQPPPPAELAAGLTAAWETYRSGDTVRSAMVASGRSWIYMRDARLDQAEETARASYESIEPHYGHRELGLLATYG